MNECPQAFDLHFDDQVVSITREELSSYAEALRLDHYARGRFSWLFVHELLVLGRTRKVNPFQIMSEIRLLEGHDGREGTKPESPFKQKPLSGLWHKHYFTARFLPKNILNHVKSGQLDAAIEKVLSADEDSSNIEKVAGRIAHEVVIGSYEQRVSERKLTGEWIVYAKHLGSNYYLCLANHQDGDSAVYDKIRAACWEQFPFLEQIMAGAR